MGAWSNRPFGNDTALDWALQLTAEKDGRLIDDTLSAVASTEIDASIGERAVAAAAVAAAAAHEPARGISEDLKAWVRRTGYVPCPQTLESAIGALESIMKRSELRDLWEESDGLPGWQRSISGVCEQIRGALEAGLPKRAPKKPGMPRVLHKLIERYKTDRDPRVLEKIRKGLENLDDPSLATKETGHRLPMTMLADAGLVDEMRSLVERGVDLAPAGVTSSETPLVAACKGRHLDTVRFLVESGVQICDEEIVDEVSGSAQWEYEFDPAAWEKAYGRQPKWVTQKTSQALWAANRHGSVEILEFLESAGADLQQRENSGESLLHKASQEGRCDIMAYLVRNGFDVNECYEECEAPIFHAIRNRRTEAVQWLIENGADINRESWLGGTPLDYAKDDTDLARLLRANGAVEGSAEGRQQQ